MRKNKGISLIVLVITIIVIIILATAILVSVISNNPIAEANKARYESDRDNMQAVFTNTVAKIAAENQGVVNVTAGQINQETSGTSKTTGQVYYTVTDAINEANASGTIIFDKGENTDTVYYIGRQLPIYAAGETIWYVDSEGIMSLEVGEDTYGMGKINEPGLYDANNVMIASWEESGIDNTCSNARTVIKNNYSSTTKVIISETVTNISDQAFYMCSNLQSVVMPNNITSIGKLAFYYCTNLTSIKIPEGVTNIGTEAFRQCANLKSIEVDKNNAVYDSRENCNAIIETATNKLVRGGKNTIIPNSVTNIGTYAFDYCSGLTSITIPDGVETIDANAFFAVSDLTSINIPKSVSNIGYRAFYKCSGLMSITVDENNTVYDSRENCNAIIETATNKLIWGCCNTVIPNSIVTIGRESFYNCSNLKEITIPDGVETIELWAFGYTGLKTVYIPQNTMLAQGPFFGCSSSLKIYCGASSKPSGWNYYWNERTWDYNHSVAQWGVTREQYNSIISE